MKTMADIAAASRIVIADTEALVADLVAKLDRAIALAEACADHAPENNAIINAGREALHEIAFFFEVEVPGLVSDGEGCSRERGH